MKSKDILKAMGKIDDKLIDEALKADKSNTSDEFEGEGCYAESITVLQPAPKRKRIIKWAGLAAGICIVAVGAVLLGRSQLFNLLGSPAAPSTETSADFSAETSDDVADSTTTEPLETTNGSISVSPDPITAPKTELLPNGLPNVPLAELMPLDEYFTARPLDYANVDGIIPTFIADGHIYCTAHNRESDNGNIRSVQLLCYDPWSGETSVISTELYKENNVIEYDILCVYGDYIYVYRSEYPYVVNAFSPDVSPYTDIANYTLCRISLTDGVIQELCEVVLELIPHRSDVVVCDDLMYFEAIEATDDKTKSQIYSINRLDLTNGLITVIADNARCPLLYQDRIVFYRNEAFWQCELDGSNETILFGDTIDFFKDRLCSYGSNIVLARSYTKHDENTDTEEGAFTIEVYDERNGFVPKALFTSEVISPEHFDIIHSAPVMQCAGGCFSFLDVIFDTETDAFVQVTPIEDKTSSQIVMADGQIYFWVYNIDWSESRPTPITDNSYFLLEKRR